jgi:hypothetical protein
VKSDARISPVTMVSLVVRMVSAEAKPLLVMSKTLVLAINAVSAVAVAKTDRVVPRWPTVQAIESVRTARVSRLVKNDRVMRATSVEMMVYAPPRALVLAIMNVLAARSAKLATVRKVRAVPTQ